MRSPYTAPTRGSRVLLFNMPFAAAASAKHGTKLVDILAPVCSYLAVVGDARIGVGGLPGHVIRHGSLPVLHYLSNVRPLPWSVLLWMLKLAWILLQGSWAIVEARNKIDVVICFQGIYYGPILLCARLLGKKAISFEPGSDVILARNVYPGVGGTMIVRGMGLLQHVIRRLAHACVIESLRLIGQTQLQQYAHKVRLGNLYVDTTFYRPTTPLEQRPMRVGFVGRLAHTKGVISLLEAAAALAGTGITFEIVGDGPLRETLVAALQRPDLAHVELVGWADGEALVQRLDQFRLMVLPTELEGLPNVVLEAMACGTPVLATAVGGIPDVIEDQVTGFILPGREPATIAAAIQAALAHPGLAAIAVRGRQHMLQSYSLTASAEQWRRVLEEGVTERRWASQEVHH